MALGRQVQSGAVGIGNGLTNFPGNTIERVLVYTSRTL